MYVALLRLRTNPNRKKTLPSPVSRSNYHLAHGTMSSAYSEFLQIVARYNKAGLQSSDWKSLSRAVGQQEDEDPTKVVSLDLCGNEVGICSREENRFETSRIFYGFPSPGSIARTRAQVRCIVLTGCSVRAICIYCHALNLRLAWQQVHLPFSPFLLERGKETALNASRLGLTHSLMCGALVSGVK